MEKYSSRRVLVVAAHPDDEILGCGGTAARMVKEGSVVSLLILGEGVTSRDEKREKNKRKKDIERLREDLYRANAVIGIKDITIDDFPDNRFDTVALLDIVKKIEKTKGRVRPVAVYTHYRNDLNIDHRITYDAVMAACRPADGETVKEIYSFEIPSSTEWNYPNTFSPNLFVDISGMIEKKIKALKAYAAELRDFPHPRSEEAVRVIAKRWGSVSGLEYAEPFECIRAVI